MSNFHEYRKRNERIRDQRCIQCGGFDVNILNGKRRCKACSMKNTIARTKLRNDRKASGVCIYCGKRAPVDGYFGCRECLDKIMERKRKSAEKRAENP